MAKWKAWVQGEARETDYDPGPQESSILNNSASFHSCQWKCTHTGKKC